MLVISQWWRNYIYLCLFVNHLYGQFGCPEKDATIAASVWCSTNATVSGL